MQTFEQVPLTAGKLVKDGLIGFVIGVVAAVLVTIGSAILTMIMWLPGLRALRKAKGEEVEMLTRGIRQDSGLVPTLKGTLQDGVLAPARRGMVDAFMEQGVPEGVAEAMVSFRGRLMYTPSRWDDLVGKVKHYLTSGYGEALISVHLRMVEKDPSIGTVELLSTMLSEGWKDPQVIRMALAQEGYTSEDFEKALRYHKVFGLAQDASMRKSFLKS
jgi:hypothetical protein